MLPILSFSQTKREIQAVKIKDSIVVKNINNLIDRETKDSSLDNPFKNGHGYISVYIEQLSHGDTLADYYLSPQLSPIRLDAPQKLYPDYYSFVNGRLIIIYVNALDHIVDRVFSTKTRKRIRRLIDKQLEKAKKQTFYDLNGKKLFTDKQFRIDYIKFDSGFHLYILKNGSYITKPD